MTGEGSYGCTGRESDLEDGGLIQTSSTSSVLSEAKIINGRTLEIIDVVGGWRLQITLRPGDREPDVECM